MTVLHWDVIELIIVHTCKEDAKIASVVRLCCRRLHANRKVREFYNIYRRSILPRILQNILKTFFNDIILHIDYSKTSYHINYTNIKVIHVGFYLNSPQFYTWIENKAVIHQANMSKPSSIGFQHRSVSQCNSNWKSNSDAHSEHSEHIEQDGTFRPPFMSTLYFDETTDLTKTFLYFVNHSKCKLYQVEKLNWSVGYISTHLYLHLCDIS